MKDLFNKLSKEKTNILVVPASEESYYFDLISKSDYLYDVKFTPMSELIKDFLGEYSYEALDKLKDNLGVTYDGAQDYLNSFLISDSKYKTLVSEYYSYSKSRVEYYKDKNLLIFLGFNYDNLISKTLLEITNRGIKVDYLESTRLNPDEFNHKFIEYPNIILEVEGLADDISNLIDKGVNQNDIYVEVNDDKYKYLIDDIFPFYNLEYDIDELIPLNSLEDVNKLIKFFKEQTNLLTIDSFKKFYETYEMDPKNKEAIESIFKGYHRIKEEYFEYLVSKVYIKKDKYTNCIHIGSFKEKLFKDNEYLFVLGANQGFFPSPYKAPGLITDETLVSLGLKSENQINTFREAYYHRRFESIKNYTISYKLKDESREYIMASIIEKLRKDSAIERHVYSNERYSKSRDIIKFFKALDINDKYGIKNDDYKNFYKLGEAERNIRDSFSNEVSFTDSDRIKKYLNNELKISSSSLSNYISCPFKYFASNILNLSPFEVTYDTYLGEFFHRVIEKYIDKDYDDSDVQLMYEELRDEYREKGFNLSDVETYFFNKFYNKLKEIVTIIKDNYKSLNHKKVLKEEKLITKEKRGDITVIKKGYPDLLIEDDKNHIMVFDYKTGTAPKFNVEASEGLQLFIYFNLYNELNKNNKTLFGVFYILINKRLKKKDPLVSIKSRFLDYDDIIDSFDPLRKYTDNKRNRVSLDDMNLMITKTNEIIEEEITNILNNEFSVKPKNASSCDFCDYQDICYRENFIVEEEEE